MSSSRSIALFSADQKTDNQGTVCLEQIVRQDTPASTVEGIQTGSKRPDHIDEFFSDHLRSGFTRGHSIRDVTRLNQESVFLHG
jgi:hypothetical protein